MDTKQKTIIGIILTLIGAIMLLISYFYDRSMPFAPYFTTLAVIGMMISVYYERKYYFQKYRHRVTN